MPSCSIPRPQNLSKLLSGHWLVATVPEMPQSWCLCGMNLFSMMVVTPKDEATNAKKLQQFRSMQFAQNPLPKGPTWKNNCQSLFPQLIGHWNCLASRSKRLFSNQGACRTKRWESILNSWLGQRQFRHWRSLTFSCKGWIWCNIWCRNFMQPKLPIWTSMLQVRSAKCGSTNLWCQTSSSLGMAEAINTYNCWSWDLAHIPLCATNCTVVMSFGYLLRKILVSTSSWRPLSKASTQFQLLQPRLLYFKTGAVRLWLGKKPQTGCP